MYAVGNPKSKKQLIEWVLSGREVEVYLPNADVTGFRQQTQGIVHVEGPHFPKPHRWGARCRIENSIIKEVLK